MKKRVAVVGSGFAAWGTVLALRNVPDVEVHVFDIGLTRAGDPLANRPVPNAKKCEGSFFCYGINDSRFPVRLDSARICSSHALGGHSVVYSGAILYPKDTDLSDWPPTSRPRAEDYAAVLASLPVMHERDSLESFFPLFPSDGDLASEPDRRVETSVVGLSRIAAIAAGDCSCPNADLRPFAIGGEFRRLEAEGALRYTGNCYVSHVGRSDGLTEVAFTIEGVPGKQAFDAVFLGAGCVNSTIVIARSAGRPVTCEYGIHAPGSVIHAFLRLPWIPTPAARLRQRYGLPEYFLEVRSPLSGDAWSHTQLTGINEQIIDAICSRTPRWLHPVVRLLRHVVYFALSGRKSGPVAEATLCSTIRNCDAVEPLQEVSITEPPIRRYPDLLRTVRRAVWRHWGTLRMVPFPFGERLADFFRRNRLGGWHFGGTLPMRENPVPYAQCWPTGQVAGLPGVFVVDSAAFPSIPASTVALLSAAHGHRVARHWAARCDLCRKGT